MVLLENFDYKHVGVEPSKSVAIGSKKINTIINFLINRLQKNNPSIQESNNYFCQML